MKQFYFLTGLPRSGSTVLSSILSQNPDIYASANSALVEVLVNVRNHLRTTEQTRAFMQPTQETDVLHSIMEGMYAFSKKPVVIDKSRAWPHPENISLLRDLLPEQPKCIAVVRDLPSILASFITLIEKNQNTASYIDTALQKQGKECSVENRCAFLFSSGGTIYESWYSLKMAFDAGLSDLFHLVEYDDLVIYPQKTLKGIYDFLELSDYEHDLTNITNTTPEDDSVYNLSGMHDVRSKLSKTSLDAHDVLGPTLTAHYASVPHFWRTETTRIQNTATNPFHLHKHGT